MARQDLKNNIFSSTSFLYGENAEYIDKLYAQFQENPDSVDFKWHSFFKSFEDTSADILKNAEGASWGEKVYKKDNNLRDSSLPSTEWAFFIEEKGTETKASVLKEVASTSSNVSCSLLEEAIKVSKIIEAYRSKGHLNATIDPLGLYHPSKINYLSLEAFGFSEKDLDRNVFVDGFLKKQFIKLKELICFLKETYCSNIGFEYTHLVDADEIIWFQQKIEEEKLSEISRESQKNILQKLVEAEIYEKYLDTKFKGTKRFGLDGSESLIPALDEVIQKSVSLGVREINFGMAHRGRLNVLSQILGKLHRAIFHEFTGGSSTPEYIPGSGDVKYHLGASSDKTVLGHSVHLSLLPNPSHLEIIDPVVIGKTRARQDLTMGSCQDEGDTLTKRSKILPIILHGDAAFSGQGVVSETFSMSGLSGYSVSGSLHIIINNQIGFTTNIQNSRSTIYASDIAKSISAPIFHINGDDVESVIKIVRLATEYRMKFHKPVVLDIYSYRRYGHNENDEPFFTQPLMYKAIRSHKTVLDIYTEKLISNGLFTKEDVDSLRTNYRSFLEKEFEESKSYLPQKADWLGKTWMGISVFDEKLENQTYKTSYPMKQLKKIGLKLVDIPDSFCVHKTIKRFLDNRKKMIDSGEGIDWSTAEALAFGSLLMDGVLVRLSGQDVERGTFSQRHSVLYDQETNVSYTPLNHLNDAEGFYEPVNSFLSEEAVLGFEYGYSLASPRSLTLWEAQFGDFANGAQVLFDQFISAGESKWLRMSGLVCLLPHGYEGQGPEHSSARLERYLQLCAENNIQVANCTTPANYFHILRRQLVRDFRKPLILMTPKSLLRHKKAVSKLSQFSNDSQFEPVLLDGLENLKLGTFTLKDDSKIRRVILCSGKVYYDLFEERERRDVSDIYLIRIEQLYPFPVELLTTILARFGHAEIVWCQEEPQNMGAWGFIQDYLKTVLSRIELKTTSIRYAGRPGAASPATSLSSNHNKELANFLENALGA